MAVLLLESVERALKVMTLFHLFAASFRSDTNKNGRSRTCHYQRELQRSFWVLSGWC